MASWGGGGPPPWRGGRGRGGGWGWGRGRWGGAPPVAPTQLPQIPPPPPNVVRIAVASSDGSGLNSLVSPRFARSPYITIVDVANGSITWVQPVKNPFEAMPRGAGVSLAQWLVQIGCRAVIGTNFGPNLSMVFQQAGVAMYTVPPGVRVIDALKMLGFVR